MKGNQQSEEIDYMPKLLMPPEPIDDAKFTAAIMA